MNPYYRGFNSAVDAKMKKQALEEYNSPEAKRARMFEMMKVPEKARQEVMVQDAKKAKTLIANNDLQGAMSFLGDRAQAISELGGDARETFEPYNAIRAGRPEEAMQMIDNFLAIAEESDTKPKQYARTISAPQVDANGQQYVIISDPNDETTKRVDVAGGVVETGDQKLNREIRKSMLNDAREIGRSAFDNLKTIRSNISTYDDVIQAIDDGASSGVISNFFPSFKQSTIELDNAGRKLGLDVISATTFGALSAPELRLAMDTGMPPLKPEALRVWAIDKKKAQEKLYREMSKMAITLGKGNMTISDYLEKVNYSTAYPDGNDDEASIMSKYGIE